ncbi:hypothetical protein FB451DRAFT_1162001 [Mycena latifolia]|nr:hypothetical protein FB451DRAFT_1162001 [Mycena latifolia]
MFGMHRKKAFWAWINACQTHEEHMHQHMHIAHVMSTCPSLCPQCHTWWSDVSVFAPGMTSVHHFAFSSQIRLLLRPKAVSNGCICVLLNTDLPCMMVPLWVRLQEGYSSLVKECLTTLDRLGCSGAAQNKGEDTHTSVQKQVPMGGMWLDRQDGHHGQGRPGTYWFGFKAATPLETTRRELETAHQTLDVANSVNEKFKAMAPNQKGNKKACVHAQSDFDEATTALNLAEFVRSGKHRWELKRQVLRWGADGGNSDSNTETREDVQATGKVQETDVDVDLSTNPRPESNEYNGINNIILMSQVDDFMNHEQALIDAMLNSASRDRDRDVSILSTMDVPIPLVASAPPNLDSPEGESIRPHIKGKIDIHIQNSAITSVRMVVGEDGVIKVLDLEDNKAIDIDVHEEKDAQPELMRQKEATSVEKGKAVEKAVDVPPMELDVDDFVASLKPPTTFNITSKTTQSQKTKKPRKPSKQKQLESLQEEEKALSIRINNVRTSIQHSNITQNELLLDAMNEAVVVLDTKRLDINKQIEELRETIRKKDKKSNKKETKGKSKAESEDEEEKEDGDSKGCTGIKGGSGSESHAGADCWRFQLTDEEKEDAESE